MLDDHKYSLRRIVAYAHRDPEQPGAMYGPGGPERTYGIVTEVHRVEGEDPTGSTPSRTPSPARPAA